MCNITKCCTEVCPEHIKITDNAIIPMKERVVDTQYDPLVWLGNKIPRRCGDGSQPQPSTGGDAAGAEAQARTRLRDKPADRAALRTLAESLRAQGRFAEAARRHPHPGRSTPAGPAPPGMDALSRTPGCCCAPSRPASSTSTHDEDEIAAALQQAQRLASTGTVLAGTHALHHLVHGRLAEAVEHAREAHRLGPRPARPAPTTWSRWPRRSPGWARARSRRPRWPRPQQLWPDNPRLAGARANLQEMGVG